MSSLHGLLSDIVFLDLGACGWVSVDHEADVACLQLADNLLSQVLNAVNLLVAPLRVSVDALDFLGCVERLTLIRELVSDKRVAAEQLRQVCRRSDVETEVQVVLSNKVLGCINLELIRHIIVTFVTILVTWHVANVNCSLLVTLSLY